MKELAVLIHERNRISMKIATIIGRPALSGHIGEYIASIIFEIILETNANAKGIDGVFTKHPLNNKTVNIKLYGKQESILDISKGNLADYYLVLSGNNGSQTSSKGKTRPLIISQVFLFNMKKLMPKLQERGVKIGIATSIRKNDWQEAMIYPNQNNLELILNQKRKDLIQLFENPNNSMEGN
jgi:hypothetical protein